VEPRRPAAGASIDQDEGTTPTAEEWPMSERWVDGDLEAGADDDQGVDPPESGAGAELGQGEASTFEPEEDNPAAEPPE